MEAAQVYAKFTSLHDESAKDFKMEEDSIMIGRNNYYDYDIQSKDPNKKGANALGNKIR